MSVPAAPAARCVYCGRPAGLSLACPAHRILLKRDPFYKMGRAAYYAEEVALRGLLTGPGPSHADKRKRVR